MGSPQAVVNIGGLLISGARFRANSLHKGAAAGQTVTSRVGVFGSCMVYLALNTEIAPPYTCSAQVVAGPRDQFAKQDVLSCGTVPFLPLADSGENSAMRPISPTISISNPPASARCSALLLPWQTSPRLGCRRGVVGENAGVDNASASNSPARSSVEHMGQRRGNRKTHRALQVALAVDADKARHQLGVRPV